MNAKPTILHIIGSDFFGSPERLIVGQIGNIPEFEFICASFVKRHSKNELLSAANSMGYRAEAIEDNFIFDPTIPARIRSLVDKYEVSLMVSHGYKADIYGFLARRRRTIPQAAYFHGWTQENLKMRIYNMIDRKVLPNLDSIIAVSGASADTLIRHGVQKDKIRVVYNAIEIDDNIREPSRTVKKKPTIGVIGRLSYEKGVHVFIRALAEIIKDAGDFKAEIYGDGGELENLKRLAKELKIADSVRFMGFTDDIDKAYENTDFLVIPSLSEGHPLVILEAWKHGLGIVATRAGGIPEIIDDGVNGILVEADNHRLLAAAILKALNDREKMNSMGKSGFNKLKEKYNTKVHYEKLAGIYTSLI